MISPQGCNFWMGELAYDTLMLKSSAIARILGISTPVSLRYFKAECEESE